MLKSPLTIRASYYEKLFSAVSPAGSFADLLDDTGIRVASSGPSLIPGENVRRICPVVQSVRKNRHRLFVSGRDYSACMKCANADICKVGCFIIFPLEIDGEYLGSLRMIWNDENIPPAERYAENLSAGEFLSESVVNGVQSELDRLKLAQYVNLFQSLASETDSPMMFAENGRLRQQNAAMRDYLLKEDDISMNQGEEVSFGPSADNNGVAMTVSSGMSVIPAVYRQTEAEYTFQNNYEVILIKQSRLPETAFSDKSSSVLIDYLEGNTPALVSFRENSVRMANNSRFFMLEGERGMGKEYWVKAICNSGMFADRELVILDCGDFADIVFANNIMDTNDGLFSRHNVIICLKEISKLSAWIQTKISDMQYELERNNIRIIATTAVPVDVLNETGELTPALFRMFYPAIMRVPPVRERTTDIPVYIQDCVTRYQSIEKKKIRITDEAMKILSGYTWPGNFQQMERIMGYLITSVKNGRITADDVRALPDFAKNDTSLNLAENEKQLITEALQRFGGPNGKEAAAAALGISRATLYRRISEYGLE